MEYRSQSSIFKNDDTDDSIQQEIEYEMDKDKVVTKGGADLDT